MANVIVTLKIMPESPDEDLSRIEAEAKAQIISFAGEGDMKLEQIPIAFGLKSIQIMFILSESKGSTEPLEKSVASIAGVGSVEITDVRRAIG